MIAIGLLTRPLCGLRGVVSTAPGDIAAAAAATMDSDPREARSGHESSSRQCLHARLP